MTLLVSTLLAMGIASFTAQSAAKKDEAVAAGRHSPQARVLIDRSTEFLFAYDVLGDFLTRNGYQVTSNRATLTPDLLQRYDIIVLQQLTTPLEFPKAVVDRVEAWTEAGGRLVLIGHAGQWERVNRARTRSGGPTEFPLNQVASRFGFRFLPEIKGEFPLRYAPHPITEHVVDLTADTYDPRARLFGPGWMQAYGVGLIAVPSDAQALITDAQGRAVMAIKKVGKGEVVVTTGKRTLWGLTRPPEPQNTEVARQLFGHLFGYLAQGAKPRAEEPPVPETLPPDKTIRLQGLTVAYAGPLKERAEFLAKEYPRLYKEMQRLFGVPPLGSITMETLASGGGGWTAGHHIGIGVTAPDNDVRAILLWEMTNAWKFPSGPTWVEVWARFTTYILRERLNIYSPAVRTLTWMNDLKALQKADPDLTKIDVSKDAPDEVAHRQKVNKVALMLLRLHQRYGDAFLHRLLRIHRVQYGDREFIGMDDLIVEMSLAAQEDLFPWFASYGTTVHPRAIAFQEAERWLHQYRRQAPSPPDQSSPEHQPG